MAKTRLWSNEYLALILVVSCWGCGSESRLTAGSDGQCMPKVLSGDFAIRSVRDVLALERKGGCSYSIAGNLSITQLTRSSLDGLSDLTAVSGDLSIIENEDLEKVRNYAKDHQSTLDT